MSSPDQVETERREDRRAVAYPVETTEIDLDGPVHYADFGGRGRPILLLHGLGGSIENWISVAPRLTRFGHVVALDLRGHGRTPLGTDGSAGVDANRRLVEGFLDEVFDEPALLIGNSMGAMISMLVAAERPHRVAGLVLIDPSVPFPDDVEGDPVVVSLFATYVTPGAGEEFVTQSSTALGPEGMVRQAMALCSADVDRIDPRVMQAHVDRAHMRESMEWRVDAFLQAARSLVEMNLRRNEYYGLIKSLTAPALLIHGDSDRLIPVEAGCAVSRLRPDWTFEIYEDTGHMPQLERPDWLVRSVERWLLATDATS